jgi:triphosphoribosyl-dephospho-CoA synthase
MPLSPDQIAGCIERACTDEVMAPKAGNVHPGVGFSNLNWRDFVDSARIVAPILAHTRTLGVGQAIYDSVKATRDRLNTNTNLGIILLLAPMAWAASAKNFRTGVTHCLHSLTENDSRLIYQAIAYAKPGGLGKAEQADVTDQSRGQPTIPILTAMGMAKDRDLIARQYANGFADVFDKAAAWIREEAPRFNGDRLLAIVAAHVRLMSALPDTLIQRKLGIDAMRQAARQAQVVQELGGLLTPAGRKAFADLDNWLRADGHKRNPGATADLIAAGLFVIEVEDLKCQ